MFVHAIVQFLKRIWVAPQDPSSSEGGYWSFVPTQVSENDPLPVDIPLSSPLVDASSGRPRLLVQTINDVSSFLFVKPTNTDTLFVGTTFITSSPNTDLLGSANTEQPTLDGCGQYRRIIWFYFRVGEDVTTYRVLARSTDRSGLPLGTGWQQLFSGTLPGGANTWGRIEIPIDIEGFYDQYRIEVRLTVGSGYNLISKIVGVL